MSEQFWITRAKWWRNMAACNGVTALIIATCAVLARDLFMGALAVPMVAMLAHGVFDGLRQRRLCIERAQSFAEGAARRHQEGRTT